MILIGTAVLALLFFFGFSYLVETFTHESTDDAFLDANIVSIAPKVAGRIEAVQVDDNEAVKKGDLLVQIDPRDLQVELDQKRAALDSAKANVNLIKASVDLFETQIATAEATVKQSQAEAAASQALAERAASDLKRAQELIGNHTISPQEFDTAKATAAAAEANLKAALEKAASDQSKVAQAQAQFQAGRMGYERAQAQTRQAEWDVQAAQLNVSYAQVKAPEDGRVTKKSVEKGNYVQAGQSLMALVPNRLFVTANFKETQLVHIRTNQPVRITIDSLAGQAFSGHVGSVMAGSGARFSLLPPENAVGNYVKVVQRVPVKILFDEPLNTGHTLGPGMSVVPSVQVSSFTISQDLLAAAAALAGMLLGGLWLWLAQRRR